PEDGGDPGVEPGDREHPGAEPAGRRHALEAELAGAEVARPGRWPGRAAQPVTPRPDVGHALLGGHRRLPSIAPGRAVRLSRATPSRARTGRPRPAAGCGPGPRCAGPPSRPAARRPRCPATAPGR